MNTALTSTAEVSAAEISRNFGVWQDKAMTSPVVVTRHGKPRVVLLSAEAFQAVRHGGNADEGQPHGYESARKALFSHMIEGFASFDLELRVTAVNRAFENMMGVTEDEMVGRTLQETFPRAQVMFIEFLRRTLKTGDVLEFEVPSSLVPGRVYRVRTFPYLGGVAAVLQSRQEEHEAQHLHSVLQAQVDAAEHLPGVGWANLSLRGAFNELSDSFSRMVGLSVNDLMGTAFSQLIKPGSRAAVSQAMESCVTERTTRSTDATMFAQDLGERPVTIVFAPVVDSAAVTGLRVAIAQRA